MLKRIDRYLRDEKGAEMVEWVIVVVVLAVVASIVFGPNGTLTTAVNTGINKISNIITTLPTSS
jgi:Flp pilus assembly pilin Flp